MSTSIMKNVWPLKLPPTRKSVLISLADQANDRGLCWPSLETISKRTCLSERSVQLALSSLEGAGLVKRVFRQGRSTHYFITAPDPMVSHKTHRNADTPAEYSPSPPQEVHLRPAPDAPRTNTEPSIESSMTAHSAITNKRKYTRKPSKTAPKNKFNHEEFDLPTWINKDLWDRWIKHRREVGRRLTPEAVRTQINFLTKQKSLGRDIEEILETSIRNGWVGIFAPKTSASLGKKIPTHSLQVNATKEWDVPL